MTTKEEILSVNRGLVDLPTTAIILIMTLGFPVLGYYQAIGYIHPIVSVILASILMNLSFTAWHEPSHGNFSKYKIVNTIAGILSSVASVYPGYFARRREHLAHHKWEGVEGKDPVYFRIQDTNAWFFPIRMVLVNMIQGNPIDIPDSFCRYTRTHKILDWLSNLTALAIVIICSFYGYFWEVMCVWIIPRGLILFIHAYYICFFPHHIPTGGYEKYRVRKGNWLFRFFTIEQNYHGIHHKWPFIPWYKYRFLFKNNKALIADNNIEVR